MSINKTYLSYENQYDLYKTFNFMRINNIIIHIY